jgi:hypothetical protein
MLGGVVAAVAISVITYWLCRRLARHVSIPFDEYIATRAAASTAARRSRIASEQSAKSHRVLRLASAAHPQRVLRRATTTHSRGIAIHDIVRIGRTQTFQIRISLN